jgi:hypothetical protein
MIPNTLAGTMLLSKNAGYQKMHPIAKCTTSFHDHWAAVMIQRIWYDYHTMIMPGVTGY